jgi:hypothetical protein
MNGMGYMLYFLQNVLMHIMWIALLKSYN